MSYTSDDIRQLRKETGRSMRDVKTALDMFKHREDAKEYLLAVCEPVKCRCGIKIGDPHP